MGPEGCTPVQEMLGSSYHFFPEDTLYGLEQISSSSARPDSAMGKTGVLPRKVHPVSYVLDG